MFVDVGGVMDDDSCCCQVLLLFLIILTDRGIQGEFCIAQHDDTVILLVCGKKPEAEFLRTISGCEHLHGRAIDPFWRCG